MPRRRIVAKRQVIPDSEFNSELVALFINQVMRRGKKAIAEKIVYGAMRKAADNAKTQNVNLDRHQDDDDDEGGEGEGGKSLIPVTPELAVLMQAMKNVSPRVEVKSRRVGGATYQIPVEVRPSRRKTLAMRWIVDSAKARSEKSMIFKLAGELLDAAAGRGSAVKKCEDTLRMAKANQAFAHFRWN